MRVDIRNIWISPGHDFSGRYGKDRDNHGVQDCESVTCTAGMGIEGDRYYGHKENYKGQITFFSEEVAAALERHFNLPSLDRSAMRRNVVISGIDLNSLIGKRFQLGELVLTGSEECAPCSWMNKAVGEGAHQWLKGNGGLRCRIEKSGQLKTGTIELKIIGDV